VWEWCWDWSGAYPAGSLSDYRGAASGTNRVLRGGNYYYAASYCPVAYRVNIIPEYSSSFLGFRVVRP
jgi:formylglycine-generating enzyme